MCILQVVHTSHLVRTSLPFPQSAIWSSGLTRPNMSAVPVLMLSARCCGDPLCSQHVAPAWNALMSFPFRSAAGWPSIHCPPRRLLHSPLVLLSGSCYSAIQYTLFPTTTTTAWPSVTASTGCTVVPFPLKVLISFCLLSCATALFFSSTFSIFFFAFVIYSRFRFLLFLPCGSFPFPSLPQFLRSSLPISRTFRYLWIRRFTFVPLSPLPLLYSGC